jgi:hypothetical protein
MTDNAGKAIVRHIFRNLMEPLVLSYRKVVERQLLPENKCAPKVLEECDRASYDACVSKLPSPHCPGGVEFSSVACGDGTKCAAIYDFSKSVLRLAPGSFTGPVNGEPTDKVSFDFPLKMPSIHSLQST